MDNHAELYRASHNPVFNANMTCFDCEHCMPGLGVTGWVCLEATESLVQLGYPAMRVPANPQNSAEDCPSFSRSAISRDGESVKGWEWESEVDRLYNEKAGK